MAKTRKNVQPSTKDSTKKTKNEEKNVRDVNNGAKAPSKEPTLSRILKRGFTSRAENPPTPQMVAAALKFYPDGVSMASIRKYLLKNYGGFGSKLSKARQAEIKEYITDEFIKGKLIMTNAKASDFDKKINMITTRWKVVNEK